MTSDASTGVLHGNTLTLDLPVPPLEGQRVRILIALADDNLQLRPEEQTEARQEWTTNGPQGPIEDEGETELP
jgi:hypothetical protein